MNSGHTKPCSWNDESTEGLHAPIGKGPRLIIVNALGESGFLQNALLIFKSGSTSGDYHKEMNSENYLKWLKQQLIPNLPPNSVVVVDNASYHNTTVDKNITSSTKKNEMQQWLNEKNIPFRGNMTKIELYNLIKSHKPAYKRFAADSLLASHGHSVLRLPPYHPELNPIETTWAIVKNWVASKNTTFKLQDVERLARTKFSEDFSETAKKIFNRVVKIENEFLEQEHFMDVHVEEIIINLQVDSSSGSDESEEEIHCIPDENYSSSDDETLGVAPLTA